MRTDVFRSGIDRLIIATATIDDVVAGPTVKVIGKAVIIARSVARAGTAVRSPARAAGLARTARVTGAVAIKDVIARTTIDRVGAIATDQRIVTCKAVNRVVAVSALDRVSPGGTQNVVGTLGPLDFV